MRETTLHQKNVITVLLFFLLYSKSVHFDTKKASKEGLNSPGFCVSVIVSFIILVKRSNCEEKYAYAFYVEIFFRYLIFFLLHFKTACV